MGKLLKFGLSHRNEFPAQVVINKIDGLFIQWNQNMTADQFTNSISQIVPATI